MTNDTVDSKEPKKFGSIRYMDASPLLRSQRLKGPWLIVAGAIVAASVAIGCYGVTSVANNVIYVEEHDQQLVTQILASPIEGSMPTVGAYMQMGNEDIVATLQQDNPQLHIELQTANKDVDVIKIAQGVKEETAVKVFQTDASKLSASQTVAALHGTWRFDVDRTAGTLMRLRFADFTSGSADAAILAAMAQQGFSQDSVIDSGLDDNGNTFRLGVFTAEDGSEYTWRILAIGLDEVYKTPGLPQNAIYVSVRMSN